MGSISSKIFEYAYKKYINKLIKKDFTPNSFVCFDNINEISDWGYNYYEYSKKIEQEYNDDFFNYNRDFLPFMVIKYYTGYNHEWINDHLRNTKTKYFTEITLKHTTKRISVLKEELKKFKTKTNLVVVRRINNSFLKEVYLKGRKLKKNIILQDLGFLSTSINLFYRKDYQGNYSRLEDETIIIIKIPQGTNALYLEPISEKEEFELLLNHGAKMRIEDKITIFRNNIILTQIV